MAGFVRCRTLATPIGYIGVSLCRRNMAAALRASGRVRRILLPKCAMYNVQCAVYNVQCAVYNVQCAMILS